MKKVMLIYPPGKLYQRGEERSQGNIYYSTATTARACNDLGYISSMLKSHGYDVFLRDYQSEKMNLSETMKDFINFDPDVLFLSITDATIFDDLDIISKIKLRKPSLMVILKGALFFDAEDKIFERIDLSSIKYLIGGESEFVISSLLDAHFRDQDLIKEIPGIVFKDGDKWIKTEQNVWQEDLDVLKFPDREQMNNKLYIRPDTGEPMATISTSRGCCFDCIFCLTPKISGRDIRLRSPDNIIKEIKECYVNHGIRNFFFKADSFTLKNIWVRELCDKILNSDLNGKIQWVANSRTNPLDEDILVLMKRAGCWLIAFGFESGSSETLRKIKKKITVENNYRAAELARRAGLRIYGFYLIGLPWEDRLHLRETEKMIYDINAEFIEIHIAMPYYGTELYKIAKRNNLLETEILGSDYFNPPIIGTKYLSKRELENFRRRILINYYLRPEFIIKRIGESKIKPKLLNNYLKFGIKLIKNNI